MRKLLVILLCFIWSISLAQTDQGSYTLFNDRSYSQVNGYASFDASMLFINESITGSLGGTFGITINHAFSTGITGAYIFKSVNEPVPILIIPPGINNYIIKRYCWYMGVIIEPTIFPRAPLHLTVPIVIGGGQLSYRLQEDNEIWCYYGYSLNKQSFFITSIGIRAELNVADGFRISVGPSYRYVTNIDFLNCLSIDISMKIGSY